MQRVKVTCEIEERSDTRKASIRVHNHWNSSKLVEIEIGGERYRVDGNDLKTAIDNCMNTRK